jgi:hypothetical protein
MSLPSLNLSFEKHTSTNLSSANDNSARNTVTLNIINPGHVSTPPPYRTSPLSTSPLSTSPLSSPPATPAPLSPSHASPPAEPLASLPVVPTHSRKPTLRPDDFPIDEETRSEVPKGKVRSGSAYGSPDFSDVEQEFKDQLLSFTTDLLLSDLDLLKNVAERGNKILFRADQLKMLIAIAYLNTEDRKKYDQLIDIETEKVIINSCLCKDCFNPFYEKIKYIHVNNSLNFLTTPFAVNMSSTFRISLEYCLTGKK